MVSGIFFLSFAVFRGIHQLPINKCVYLWVSRHTKQKTGISDTDPRHESISHTEQITIHIQLHEGPVHYFYVILQTPTWSKDNVQQS